MEKYDILIAVPFYLGEDIHNSMDTDSIGTICTLILLLLLSAFFSATETAFSSLNKIRIKSMAQEGNKRASQALKLLENYDKLLTTILVGNNIVNIMTASMATVLFVQLMGSAGAGVATTVTTVVVLLFGEITPKSMAKEAPEKFTMLAAPLVQALVVVLTPVNYLFTAWKKLMSRIIKSTPAAGITEDELLTLLAEAEQEGAINEDDSLLIHNAIEFDDMVVEDILTPRVDMVGVPLDADKDEIAGVFRKWGYSRLPVFDDGMDHIVGIIHLRDFYQNVMDAPYLALKDIIKPVMFVMPAMKISDVFQQLKATKSHFAVVADEYGGTVGMVTMEDILEEIVGEIWDENDDIEEKFVAIAQDVYQVNCAMNVQDMFEQFSIQSTAASTTVSGWIMEQLGRLPVPGDSFRAGDFLVTVQNTDKRRVLTCTIARAECEETAS